MKIFYSNRLEELYPYLKQCLFENSSPFERRLIIVPTRSIKSWILLQLAQDQEVGIAAGIEILYIEEALKEFLSLLSWPSKQLPHYPSLLEMTLYIECFIRHQIFNWQNLSSFQQKIWLPLFDYLKINFKEEPASFLSKRSEKRLAHLSHHLASLFKDYEIYGYKMVEKWSSHTPEWQQAIWHQLFFAENKNWSYLTKYPFSFQKISAEIKIHFFALDFLPETQYRLIEQLAEQIPTYFYFFSPCCVFWSDILSDNEVRKLQIFWHKKGAPLKQQKSLRNYLNDRNPLLANWSKLGRNMVDLIEQSDHEIVTAHVIPAHSTLLEEYPFFTQNLIYSPSAGAAPTLLEYLQCDILFMHSRKERKNIEITKDQSVQLHISPTQYREVQILYQNLLHIIKNNQGIEPQDILVMAPDIALYIPYIQYVFGGSDSQLDFQITDAQTMAKDSFLLQFWHLINLPFGRWDTNDLLYLFQFSNFQKKHQISSEDLVQLQTWLKETNIQWGDNAHHRNELLRQRYCQDIIDNTSLGTWEGGFSRLLLGLTMDEVLLESNTSILPYRLEASQGMLLGKCISLLSSLKKDLEVLTTSTEKTYQEWMQILQNLILNCLVEECDQEKANETLIDPLNKFAQASCWVSDHKVKFFTVKQHLELYLKKHDFTYHENHLHAVKFCSLLSMGAIPCKVVALMGMNETLFPRQDFSFALNLLKEGSFPDYYPSSEDDDRYLFLKSLFSARKCLLLSYAHYIAGDHKQQNPSSLITELFKYIDENFVDQEDKTSSLITFIHPYHSFDSQYFIKESKIFNYSLYDYQAALGYYKEKKDSPHSFLHHLKSNFSLSMDSSSSPIILDIRQLKTALLNPIKSYFNNGLGIFIKEEEQDNSQEPFVVNSLQLFDFKQSFLKGALNPALKMAELKANLPRGLFKQAALIHIQNSLERYQDTLQKLGVSTGEVREIVLHEQYETVKQEDEKWKIPPLEIYYKNRMVKITGSISPVTSTGLLAHISGNKYDILKPWCEFIILNIINEKHQLPIKNQLLCTKSGKIKQPYFHEANAILKQILDYYFKSIHTLSPLTQEWLYDFVYQDVLSLQKNIYKSLNNPFTPLYNPYLKWIYRSNIFNISELLEEWQTIAKDVFSPPFQGWIGKDDHI